MEKVLIIDGREVGFKSSGATARIYRERFGREFFDDVAALSQEVSQNGGSLTRGSLGYTILENLAYCMAYQYDHSIPADPTDWLDTFGIFSIYQAAPDLVDLIQENQEQIEEPKKKEDELSAV